MRDLEKPGRSPAHGMKGMAATSHTLSTQTAIDILRAGGNALDAAIAACAVQCVVEPGSTGIGGDNFCLYSRAGSDTPIAFNGSGKAPTGATCEYYASNGITELQRQTPHSCVVPGAIDAWCKLNADHGKLPMKDILAPAIEYARDGYPVSSRVHSDWTSAVALMQAEPTMAKTFLVDGGAPAVGAVHRQPELARTMQAVADGGRDAFYTGEIANRITGIAEDQAGNLWLGTDAFRGLAMSAPESPVLWIP